MLRLSMLSLSIAFEFLSIFFRLTIMSVKEDITDRLFEANQGAANDSINMVSNDTNAFPFYVASGIVFFAIVNYLTRFMVPETVTKNFQSRWKWRNVLTSFIHSFITGTWAPLAFYVDPSIGNDMIYSFNTSIHVLGTILYKHFIRLTLKVSIATAIQYNQDLLNTIMSIA